MRSWLQQASGRRYPGIRPRFYDAMRWTARRLLGVLTRTRISGLEHCPHRGPAIFVTNHLSYFDAPLLFAALPVRLRPLVAIEYRQRAYGPFLDVAGAIYVERGRPDRAALRALLEVLEDGGFLGVAIEGGISDDRRLQAGKNGVAYLAAKTSAALVPVAIWGTEDLVPSLRRWRRPALHVRLGPALALDAPAADVARLDDSTRAVIRRIAAMLPEDYLSDSRP